VGDVVTLSILRAVAFAADAVPSLAALPRTGKRREPAIRGDFASHNFEKSLIFRAYPHDIYTRPILANSPTKNSLNKRTRSGCWRVE
jgi:hypothetical protein